MAKKRAKKKTPRKTTRKRKVAAKVAKKSPRKKASARKVRRAAAPRKASKKKDEALRPEPGQVVVRMYRQGLGDCFLLAFGTRSRSKPRYLLIDCGVHMRQREGTTRLMQVMKHMAAATNNHLHVVVATHEHADHLSGFVQKDSPFFKDSLKIDQLWVAWTERFGDPDADHLRKEKAAAREVIKKAVDVARSKANEQLTALADQLQGLMDFEEPDKEPLDDAERDAILAKIDGLAGNNAGRKLRVSEFKSVFTPGGPGLAAGATPKKPTSNELALGLLAAKADSVEYLVPGETAPIDGARHVRAYVLGPPKNEVFLKKDLPTKVRGGGEHDYKETYLSKSVELQALGLAPALAMDWRSDRAADQRHPFIYEYRRKLRAKPAESSAIWGETLKWADPTNDFFTQHYFENEYDWRSIEGDWMAPAEQLALHLDSDTNNTTLVLAFELGEPGSGDVLLFAGDAQVGNWLSWREQSYTAGGKTVTVDDLLKRTLVYKVGHHGSHNATLKHYVRPGSHDTEEPYGLELMDNVVALLPVDQDAAGRPMPNPWRMPHHPLYQRLRTKSDRRVLRSDLSIEPLSQSAALDVYPDSTEWTAVPGKPDLSWRRSVEEFKDGTDGPLCYDIQIPIRNETE